MTNEELKQLKTFHDQLQKMVNYFNKKKQTSKLTKLGRVLELESLAEDLDEIRTSISRKIGNLEGWYTGECEF